MEAEILIELRVVDFECTPSEITKILNIQPSVTWVKGEAKGKSGKGSQKFQENGWTWSRKLQASEGVMDFSSLFADLYKEVSPIRDRFKQLPAQTCVQLACIAYILERAPAFSLQEPLIRLLADINSSVDYDIYLLSSDSATE